MSLTLWWLKKVAKLAAWIAEEAKNDPDASYAEYAEAKKEAEKYADEVKQVMAKDFTDK